MSSACVDYVPALCTHRPSLLPIEWSGELFGPWQRLWFAKLMLGEDTQTLLFRGRRSRNKVSVGEPAEGSFAQNVWTPSFIFESRAEDAPITSFSLRLLDADIWISELWSKISFRGRCLGSSSDEERSEMRFTTWTAKFRELLDLWTHAAIWRNPDCSFPSVYLSSVSHCSVHGVLGSTFSVWLDKN